MGVGTDKRGPAAVLLLRLEDTSSSKHAHAHAQARTHAQAVLSWLPCGYVT